MKDFFFSLLLLLYFVDGIAQGNMQLQINGKTEALNKPYYKIGDKDSVTILIDLPEGVDANSFLSKVDAKVCRPVQHQNQSQKQQVHDQITIFKKVGEQVGDFFSQKKENYIQTLSNSNQDKTVKIVFRGTINSCDNNFFWVRLTVNPSYQKMVSTIKNFKSELRLKKKP
ncbi:hypothetical protein [Longitalea arenae]|uniref:hypothetical protein n=1 Tax=Longitalea arenae TaxID=2812558 RepID=UPI0019671904|nr:hypothetical protein [Longitalea arenae]